MSDARLRSGVLHLIGVIRVMKLLAGLRLLCVHAALLVVLGCGAGSGPTGSVEGTVTLDGEAVEAGVQIVFIETSTGKSVTGSTDESGNYKLETVDSAGTLIGVPIGTYQVTVTSSDNSTEMTDEEYEIYMDSSQTVQDQMDADHAGDNFIIPDKFHAAETSGFEFTVEDSENTIDLALKT